jgi:spermidine synthase
MDYGKSELEKTVLDYPNLDFPKVLLENFHHFENILSVTKTYSLGCGSYLFLGGQEYKYSSEMLAKQEELFQVGKKCQNVLEMGVYLGHSLLIFLLSNPNLRITCVDIDKRFSPHAVEYLNTHFNNRITFHLGDANNFINSLPDTENFDCVHVDAQHNEVAVRSQFLASKRVSKLDAIFVFDDYDLVKGLIDKLIDSKELKLLSLPGCKHTNIVTQLTTSTP